MLVSCQRMLLSVETPLASPWTRAAATKWAVRYTRPAQLVEFQTKFCTFLVNFVPKCNRRCPVKENVLSICLTREGGGGRVNGLLTSELRLRTAIISRGPMTGNSRHHSFPANEERLRVFFSFGGRPVLWCRPVNCK